MDNDEVTEILSNPVWAGVGPWAATVPEEDWVEATARLIEELGVEEYTARLAENLHNYLGIKIPVAVLRQDIQKIADEYGTERCAREVLLMARVAFDRCPAEHKAHIARLAAQ